jgi:hypothetical protein
MHDVLFAHPLEERMANILDREHIPWKYAVSFKVRSKHGSRSREVDFVLGRDVNVIHIPKSVERKVYGPIRGPVRYVEVKTRMEDRRGHPNNHAIKQHKELRAVGKWTLIVTEKMIEFFERNGFERK